MVDFSGFKNALEKVTTPDAETQAVIEKMTLSAQKVQDTITQGAQNAKAAVDSLMAKMGVKAPSLLKGTAEEIADQPSPVKAGENKQVERSAAMAEYTAGLYGEKQALQTTHWRDKFSKGQEIAAETTASPAGALPPG